MELFEFTKIIKEFTDYYERAKEPKQGTIELWYGKVKSIPSEPIPWILRKVEEENETFPRNLPGILWAFYREWMQANPDRVARKDYQDCPDCTDGLIWARQVKNGHRYTYVFRCLKCRQNTTQAYPFASRLELSADYDVMPKDGDPYTGKKPQVKMRPAERTNELQHVEPVILRER